MNKRTLNLLMTLSLLVLMPTVVFAHKGGHHKGDHFEKMMEELNLTDAQKKQMDVLKANKAFGKEDRKKMKELREKFFAALKGSATDAELTKIHLEMKTMKDKKDESRFKHMLEVRKILTAEQKAKFHEVREKKMKKWKDRMDEEDEKD